MTKNSTLNKKLKSYSALAGTLVAAANTANAQIVYTDVTPDATVNTGGTYDLDLDNDGNIDFQFVLQAGTYMYGTFAIPYNVGLLAPAPGNAIDTLGGAVAHNLNDMLNASSLWCDDAGAAYQLMGVNIPLLSYSTGNFIGQTDKYLGLRFKIAGADHYGWARLDMDAAATAYTIKDYAYDATAGNPIPCGAMVTAINESTVLANTVSIFSANNTISVDMNNAAVEGVITITNTLGQVVSSTSITNTKMNIPMNTVNAGIYFVTIEQNSAKCTKKVIIK